MTNSNMPVLKPAAQYLRMSTDSQTCSLEQQASTIAEFAALHGYEIVQSYEDAGRSGVTSKGRAGLASLLADVVGGSRYKTVLVLDVSRWGRYQDPDEAAHYEFLCRSAGVSVRYCAEVFGDDFSAPIMKQLKRVMESTAGNCRQRCGEASGDRPSAALQGAADARTVCNASRFFQTGLTAGHC